MAKETREPQADYDYPRFLLFERRRELAALQLRDPRIYLSPTERSSCIRALQDAIVELERLLQNDSHAGSTCETIVSSDALPRYSK